MVVGELDEVHYDLEVDGELVRRQLARQIWERAGWATVAVAFTERDRDGGWKPAKIALVRFRRLHDAWHKQAVITLPADEAAALAATLTGWRDLSGGP